MVVWVMIACATVSFTFKCPPNGWHIASKYDTFEMCNDELYAKREKHIIALTCVEYKYD